MINNTILKKDIIRHNYITKSITIMIDDLKLNDNLNWVSNEDYFKYLKIFFQKEKDSLYDESSEEKL